MKQFIDIPIGGYFVCNGNLCEKKSSRTALLLQFNKSFYFAQSTPVHEDVICRRVTT